MEKYESDSIPALRTEVPSNSEHHQGMESRVAFSGFHQNGGDKIPAWPTKFNGEFREKLEDDFNVYSKISFLFFGTAMMI